MCTSGGSLPDVQGDENMNRRIEAGEDMTSGPLLKKMLLFALPIMGMSCLQLLFSAADMVVVGRFCGKEALGAVGAVGSPIGLLLGLFLGLSVGTSVVVAQDYGAQDWDGVSRAVHTSILAGALIGVMTMGVGQIFCGPLLESIETPANILDMSILYMRIYLFGVPANMVYNFSAAALRAMGDSKRPMYYLVISGAVNAVLNVLFVVVFRRSVDGVALATIISQYLAMGMILRCLCRSGGPAVLEWKRLRIDRQKLRTVLRIGIPAGAQSVLFSISGVLIQSGVNSFGSDFVAGKAAYDNLEGFANSVASAYTSTAITFTGQCMGAKKYDRIDRVAKQCALQVMLITAIVSAFFIIFGEKLLGIYSDDPNVIEYGMLHMYVIMSGLALCGFMLAFPGVTRGMGYSVLPTVCTLLGACVMRIVWIRTVFVWYPLPAVLLACYPVSWVLTNIGQLAVFFYARKKVRSQQLVS